MLLDFCNAEGAHNCLPRVCYYPVYVLLALLTKVVLIAEQVMTLYVIRSIFWNYVLLLPVFAKYFPCLSQSSKAIGI